MSKISKYEILHFFMHFCNDMRKKACLGDCEIKSITNFVKNNWELEWKAPCEIVPHGTVGGWRLCYSSCYGGWVIEEIDNETGGVNCPLGSKRYKSSEFFNMICFAREVIRLQRQEENTNMQTNYLVL